MGDIGGCLSFLPYRFRQLRCKATWSLIPRSEYVSTRIRDAMAAHAIHKWGVESVLSPDEELQLVFRLYRVWRMADCNTSARSWGHLPCLHPCSSRMKYPCN